MIAVWVGAVVLAGAFAASGGLAGLLGVVALPVVLLAAWGHGRSRDVNRGGRVTLLAVLTVLGLVAFGRVLSLPDPPSLLDAVAVDRVEGVVVSPIATDLRWQSFDLRLERVREGDTWRDADAVVRAMAPASPTLGFADRVGLSGELTAVEDIEPGYADYLIGQGLSGQVFGRSVWVEKPGSGPLRTVYGWGSVIAERLRRAAPGDSGVLLGGLVVGDDSALSDETEAAFRATGMSHLTAVSGSNLALVVVVLMGAARPLGRRWDGPLVVAVVAALWLYAVVTGLDPPVLRAALMATIALAARPFGRRVDYLSTAALSAAVMMLAAPTLIDDVGFQLSLAASVAIAAVAAGLRAFTVAEIIDVAFRGTLAAQVATIPITVDAFGTFSPLSVPVNLLIGPLAGLAFPLAFAGALLMGIPWPGAPIGGAVVDVAASLADLILYVVRTAGGVSFARLTVPVATVGWRVGLVVGSVAVVLLLSRDGRRWLARSLRTVRTGSATGRPVRGAPARVDPR